MDEELKEILDGCAKSLLEYQPQNASRLDSLAQWVACVTHFQENDYEAVLKQAAELLRIRGTRQWFPLLQMLLAALQRTQDRDEATQWIATLVNAAPLSPWQLDLTNLMHGKIGVEAVLERHKDETQLCQAYYYRGEHLLCVGREKEAQEAFGQSANACTECLELYLAKARLETLGRGSAKHIGEADDFELVVGHSFVPVAPTLKERDKYLRLGSGEKMLAAVSQLASGTSIEDITLLSDKNRSDAWSRIVAKMVPSLKAARHTPGDVHHQWLPRKARYELADAYKKVFLERIQSVGLVEDHLVTGEFEFIEGAELLRHSRFPRYQVNRGNLVSGNTLRADMAKYFVSHRWLSADHPDPTGQQFSLLKRAILPNAYYWIDYACMPQRPRTDVEEEQFRARLKWMPSLLFDRNVIVLRCLGDGYFDRAWCFFELLTASVLGREIACVTDDELGIAGTDNDERLVLERTLAEMDLPDTLGTSDPEYLEAIQELVQNVALFFKLRVIEHYMDLGQMISGGALYFGEDPYYYMATCDFSKMMLWLFDVAKRNNRRLIDLTKRDDMKLLPLLAKATDLSRSSRSYSMSKKVALDAERLQWFFKNRTREDFECRLFYEMTAMIE